MPKAYLTIDDTPTNDSDRLIDYLVAKNIPAVLYCIGSAYTDIHLNCEGIEQNPAPVKRAIEKGFVIGNHTYTHRRSSELPFEEVISEIEKTEKLIDGLYKQAGKTRTHKLMRFPHLDRGCGGWVVDFDAAGKHRKVLEDLFFGGLNVALTPPTDAQIEKKQKIQDYLHREGFSSDPFKGVTLSWYAETEMAKAADNLMTFSTADWMMNPDFKTIGDERNWPHRSMASLKAKIDSDPYLWRDDTNHIVLAHDHNRMFEVTRDLVAHMKAKGMEFIGL